MPNFPAGIQLTTILFGKGVSPTGDSKDASLTVEVVFGSTAASAIVWAADGTPLYRLADSFKSPAGEIGSAQVPVVDQDGWIDGKGDAYTMWGYRLTERVAGLTRVKYWQPLMGQVEVDFDMIPDGTLGLPVVAPTAVVTSVNGQTGAVEISEPDVSGLLSVEEKGASEGVAPLDQDRKLFTENLPEYLGSGKVAPLVSGRVPDTNLPTRLAADKVAPLESGKLPEANVPDRLTEPALSATIAEVAEPLADEGPARGGAPKVSVRANLGKFHTPPSRASLIPLRAGSLPRINVNTVTGISNAVTVPVLADNSSPIKWDGPIRVTTQTLGGVAGCLLPQDVRSPATQGIAGIRHRFSTDAPNLVLDGSWGSSPILILRDGELITEGAIAAPGSRYLRILAYEYTGFHEYEIIGGPGTALASVIVGPNDTVRPPDELGPLIGFMTDSYGSFQTILGTTTMGLIGAIARLMGWRVRLSVEGGSGYQTNGAGGAGTAFADRLSAFNGLDLDGMVFLGGRNDATSGLQAAATARVATFQDANPGVPVIIGGPWAPSSSWETGGQAGNFAALAAAAAAREAIYVDTKGIITGEGDIPANTTAAGNASRFIASAHPTPPSATDGIYYADGRQYHAIEFVRRMLPLIGAAS